MSPDPQRRWLFEARRSRCVMCGAPRPRGHHVITQQQLKRTPGGEDKLWDLRNMLPLCDRCHAGHHSKMKQVPLTKVLLKCPGIVAFASELGLTWYLSREYGLTRPRRVS